MAKVVKKKPAKPKAVKAKGVSAAVRMYNQGLGDCFLLRFPKADGTPFYVLIDCGVITGTPNAKDRMTLVIDDIFETTGGLIDKASGKVIRPAHIDLVVGTHEHWDHLSSFSDLQAEWDKFTFGAVWLGWTEDFSNKIAQGYIAERKEKLAHLAKSAKQMKLRMGANATPVLSETEDVLSFFGVDLNDPDTIPPLEPGQNFGAKPTKAGKDFIGQAMQYLRDCKGIQYCKPGQVLTLPQVPGVEVFVLGPPTDPSQMKRDLPKKSEEGTATYHMNTYHRMNRLTDPADESDVPFDAKYRISEEDAKTIGFFREFYYDETQAWRNIDDAWATDLPQMALKLDSDTNNTSLALAFRLADGRVLLFPGDAQVGNWESWHADSQGKELIFDDGQKKLHAKDLLAKVAVYKVGHHGSHNATHKELGLELMADNFVAFLPCEEFTAHEKKKWGKMPFEPIRKRLREKHAHIVQVDQPLPPMPAGQEIATSDTKLIAQINTAGDEKPRPLWYEYELG
jgi:glyoxylase-like metal-dependent hydrolase (beta-lactamase superfamily II)